MTFRVEITPEAERQAEHARAWWRSHRGKAPTLFDDEFEVGLGFLSETPNSLLKLELGFRRYLMVKTQFHIYFDVSGSTVLVHAVWSAIRGRPPPSSKR